jgi:hypothetical protein
MNLSQDQIDWIKTKLKEFHNPRFTVKDETFREEVIEDQFGLMLYCINKDNPSDIKEYVENRLRQEGYERELSAFNYEVEKVDPKDKKKTDALFKKLNGLVEKIKKEDPDFYKEWSIGFGRAHLLLVCKIRGEDIET